MKVAILGDIHGDLPFLNRALGLATAKGAELVIQVGDFGFTYPDGFLAGIDWLTKDYQMPLCVIRGNHDDPFWFKQYQRMGYVNFIPDGQIMTIGKSRVAFLGGAVSIDRDFREENISWWRNERVNPNIVREWSYRDTKADILISHESPATPPSLGPPPMTITQKIEEDCQEDRLWVKSAVETLEVSEVYHGHYHHRETYEFIYGDSKKALVEGLDCNGAELSDAVIIGEF